MWYFNRWYQKGIICQGGCFGVSLPVQAHGLHTHSSRQPRISNVEQGLPAFGGAGGDQGISNDELQELSFFPSTFIIHYSTFCGSLLISDQFPKRLQLSQ
jgi:hypothetical protein